MTPEELVSNACPKIGSIGSAFYFVPETVEAGKALGLDTFRFYFLGRGGVLGDVEARVVQSAFGYFEPSTVEKMWNSARGIVSPMEAGRAYLQCSARFGRDRLGGVEGLAELCDACEAVNSAADPTALPLYAGISAEPLPDDLPGRAMQLIAVLRELRGSAHLAAIVCSGLEPKIAHFLRRPDALALFGWPTDPLPEPTDEDRRKLGDADELTDRMVMRPFSVLDESGRSALLAGLDGIQAALTRE